MDADSLAESDAKATLAACPNAVELRILGAMEFDLAWLENRCSTS
jgi:hypothetical protein